MTTNDLTQRNALDNLENEYWLYKRRVAEEKAAVNDRLEKDRERLSKAMHEAEDAGVTKTDIRAKVRAYSNNRVFYPLWNAWTPPADETEDVDF